MFKTNSNSRYLFCIFAFLPVLLFAQTVSLSGRFVDEKNLPIEFLEVAIYKNDSLILSELSDENGKFQFTVEPSSYKLTAENFGEILFENQFNITENTNFGNINIANSNVVLQEAVITGKMKLIERKVDRLIFNIENVISGIGGDALDALKITPGVQVNNEQISMIGKGGVGIMIDGRFLQLSSEETINFLKTISFSDIKSIEVITTPPSKYTAEGNSGLINIIIKKTRNNIWNSSIRVSYQQSTHFLGSSSGSFNFQRNRFTLLSAINYVNGSYAPIESNTIQYPDFIWKEKNRRRDFSNALSSRIGIDYNISKKIITGFLYSYANSLPEMSERINSSIINPFSNQLDSLIVTDANTFRERDSHNLNYHIIYDIDSLGRKLSFDFDLINYNLNSKRIFQTNTYLDNDSIIPNSYNAANNIGTQKIDNYSFNLDMEHPTKWANINYGGRISITNTKNTFEYYDLTNGTEILDVNRSNSFNYEENTQAVYISSYKQLSEKWEAKIGVRLENTSAKGISVTLNQINESKYTQLFPTAYISYTPNGTNNFNLSYGKRISRPSFSWLNPFRYYNNEYSYSEGNPFLEPSFSHNIDFTHSYKEGILVSSLYYSLEKNDYNQINFTDSLGYRLNKPDNFYDVHTIGLSEYYVFRKISWWESVNSINLYYRNVISDYSFTNTDNNGFSGRVTSINTFKFSKNHSLELSYWYQLPDFQGSYKTSSASNLSFSYRTTLLDRKLQLAIFFNDIFRTSQRKLEDNINGINQRFDNYYDNRFFRFSVVYILGGNVKGKVRESRNSEEKERMTNL